MDSENEAPLFSETESPAVADGKSGWVRGIVIALILLSLVIAVMRARVRPLWYDELFSYHLAEIPRLSDFRASLTSGIDLTPPLFNISAWSLFQLLGPSSLVLRIPSILGYGIFSLCVYRVAARRVAPVYAGLAAVFPLVTEAFSFAFEGRPYGMVLAFSGMALAAWQTATDGRSRRLALPLMTLSLAGGVASHFYAVLVFIPLGLGELVRTWNRKRIDLGLWVALFGGLFPLIFLRDIIKASSSYKGIFWTKAWWGDGALFYNFLLRDTLVPFVVILAYWVIDTQLLRRGDQVRSSEPPKPAPQPIPMHDVVAALAFVILPFFGVGLSIIATDGAFTDRYALPAVIGIALCLAYVGQRLGARRTLPGVVMAASILGWFLLTEAYLLHRGPAPALSVAKATFAKAEGSDLPIVVSWAKLFLQGDHELPRSLADRLVYLVDGRTVDNIGLELMTQYIPLHVKKLDPFLRSHDRFYLCGFPNDATFRSIINRGATVTILDARRFREGEAILAHVDMAAGARPSVADLRPVR